MKKNSLVLASLMLAFVLTSFYVSQKQDKPYPIDDILAKTTNDQLPMSIVLYYSTRRFLFYSIYIQPAQLFEPTLEQFDF